MLTTTAYNPQTTLIDLEKAFEVIRDSSIFPKDASIYSLICSHYESAKELAGLVTDVTSFKSALSELIKGIYTNVFRLEFTDGTVVKSMQTEPEVETAKISVQIADGVATLTVPHFDVYADATRQEEWKIIKDQLAEIRQQSKIRLDIRNCQKTSSNTLSDFMTSVFGTEFWLSHYRERYKDVTYEMRKSEGYRAFIQGRIDAVVKYDPENAKKLKESVLDPMDNTDSDIVSGTYLDNCVTPELTIPNYEGEIEIVVNSGISGAAFEILYSLSGVDRVKIIGQAPKVPVYLQLCKVTLPSGTVLTVPVKKFTYPADFPFPPENIG